jgi:hypothetical protein
MYRCEATVTRYEIERNKLIPVAERYANDKEGREPRKGQARDEWVQRWNTCFSRTMVALAESKGLCVYRGEISFTTA